MVGKGVSLMEICLLTSIEERLGVAVLQEVLSLDAQWRNVKDFSEPSDGERILKRKMAIMRDSDSHERNEIEHAHVRYMHGQASPAQVELLKKAGIIRVPD